ncbi:acyltransferase family protein [Paenibacillus sp. NPDC056579]|uniref:acyltransferase family protein n=1 Tax=Paenibacillus sp. NPDC056579 TaxID=3345871 RepID=UPI0036923B47
MHRKDQKFKEVWIRRFFRLYPLYWFNLLAAVLLAYFYFNVSEKPIFSIILANITMIQKFLEKPDIVELFWTLSVEMVFYCLCSLLFLFGFFRRYLLAIAFFFLALISSATPIAGIRIPGWGLFFNLFTMFFGTIIYRYVHDQLRGRLFALTFILSTILTTVVCFNVFWGDNDPNFLGTHSFIPMLTAWVLAYISFFLLVRNKLQRGTKLLVLFGVISYSIYLMHPLVIEILPQLNNKTWTFILWSAITFATAILTYFGIERPFISIGRRAFS